MLSFSFKKQALHLFLAAAILSSGSVHYTAFAQSGRAWIDNEHKVFVSKKPKDLEKLAAKGQADAACYLGMLYLDGNIVNGKIAITGGDHPPDFANASIWLHRAAELGFVDASGEFWISILYSAEKYNNYVSSAQLQASTSELHFWLKRAVDHGSTEAPALYAREFPSFNLADNFALSKRGADSGDFLAQIQVGRAYLIGEGTSRDQAAADHYLAAADRNDPKDEVTIARTYLDAGEGANALVYLKKATQQPLHHEGHVGYDPSSDQQNAWQIMGDIFMGGKGVAPDAAMAKLCFDNKRQLADYDQAEQAGFDSRQAAREANQQTTLEAFTQGLSNLAQQAATPSPSQEALNQQLSNINAINARNQQVRAQQAANDAAAAAQRATQTAPQRSATTVAASPPPRPIGPATSTPPFHPTSQFPSTASPTPPQTTSGGSSMSSASANGKERPDGPAEDGCLQLSRDAKAYPMFHNACGFPLHYYWTPINPRQGEFKVQNRTISPYETQTGNEGNGEQIKVYACLTTYLVRNVDGTSIYGPIRSYRCMAP